MFFRLCGDIKSLVGEFFITLSLCRLVVLGESELVNIFKVYCSNYTTAFVYVCLICRADGRTDVQKKWIRVTALKKGKRGKRQKNYRQCNCCGPETT